MLPRKVFFAFLLWFIPLALSAQRYVSGRVIDAEDGVPIPGAAVFIANTTAGTTTDADGNYRLKIPGEGSYRLTVLHVGYQPVFKNIETKEMLEVFNAAMNVREIEEVTVSAKVKARKDDVDIFWKTLLGKNPSQKNIYATNPKDAYFYYNPETQKLTVTSRVPLQIVNNETGYHIQFVLERFTHDYKTNITSWEGQYMFNELEPENYRQKNIWERNNLSFG